MRANTSVDGSVDGCSQEKNSRALSFRSLGDQDSEDQEESRGKKRAILDWMEGRRFVVLGSGCELSAENHTREVVDGVIARNQISS